MKKIVFCLLVAALATGSFACEKKQDQPAAEAPEGQTAAQPAEENAEENAEQGAAAQGATAGGTAAQELPKMVAAPTNEALTAYLEAREALFNDRMEGLEDFGTRIQESATKAAENAGDDLKPSLQALASAGGRFHETAGQGNVEDIRKAFGDVSKAMIETLTKAPSLAQGLHTFECGMAPGYDKWVQKEEEIANPYMGQKMPKCGSRAELAP